MILEWIIHIQKVTMFGPHGYIHDILAPMDKKCYMKGPVLLPLMLRKLFLSNLILFLRDRRIPRIASALESGVARAPTELEVRFRISSISGTRCCNKGEVAAMARIKQLERQLGYEFANQCNSKKGGNIGRQNTHA